MSLNTRLTRAMDCIRPLAAHGLIYVHGVQTRRIKAGQPHVAHDHYLQWVGSHRGTAWPGPSRRGLLRMCGCHFRGSDAEPVITTLIAPCMSSSLCQSGRRLTSSVVEVNADAAAHADDHSLARLGLSRRCSKCWTMSLGNQLQSLFSADNGLQLCPLGLDLLLALYLLAPRSLPLNLGSMSGRWLSLRASLAEPALVVDGHRGSILDRALGCRRC